MKATLYYIYSGFSNVPDGVSVNEPCAEINYCPEVYELPKGFTVDSDIYGMKYIKDENGIEFKPYTKRLKNGNHTVYLVSEELRDYRSFRLLEAKSPREIKSIRTARIEAGITQKQLSDLSGVNIRQIQKAEAGEIKAGNMSAANLLSIADALGVDPRELIADEG